MNKRISPCGLVANLLDCDIIVSKFKLQLYYSVYFPTNIFWKGMNTFIPLIMGYIVPTRKVDMQLNKKKKTKL